MSELFKTYNNEKQQCLLFSKSSNVPNFDDLDSFKSWLENNGLILDKLINKTDSSKYDYFVPFYFTDGTQKISYSNSHSFSYTYIANNYIYNSEYLMFNYMDWCNWMDNNNGWDSYFTTDQCARGLNNLKSAPQSIYSFDAEPNQKNFFNLFLYSEGTSYLYNYKVRPCMLNPNADYSVYVEGIKSGNNCSTDLSVSSLNPTTFTLGFEAVISASNLDDYIQRATAQQGSDTYPYWKRFLAIGIKGGFSDSRYDLAQSSFVKICSFDNSTEQFKLTYKKIKNNVYYIKDENFKTYTLPIKYLNKYVIKSVVYSGSTYYYNGSPYSYDNTEWTSDIASATKFNTPDDAEPIKTAARAQGSHGTVTCEEYITDSTIRNYYGTKLSIPVMMPCGNISRNVDNLYYIFGKYNNETYAYKGPLNASQFTPGDSNWTNKYFIIVDDRLAKQYNYLQINGSTTSWTPYIDQATYFSESEVNTITGGDILKRYAVYNGHSNPSDPWHDGYWIADPTLQYSGIFSRAVTIDSDETTKYNTTAEAQAVINYLMSNKPSNVTLNLSIESTTYPRTEASLFYYVSTVFPEYNSDYSTLYSTITADSNTKNKYNPLTAYSTNVAFDSKFQTLYSNHTYYASNNAMSELSTTRFLALNYFLKTNQDS